MSLATSMLREALLAHPTVLPLHTNLEGSKRSRISPHAGHPWVLHVYSPAFRRNPTAPADDQIPLFAIHEPESEYHRLILVDSADFVQAKARVNVAKPIPSGIGGGVVAAIWLDAPFDVCTLDAWNWGRNGLPPWLEIGERTTRDDLYQQVLAKYTKGGK